MAQSLRFAPVRRKQKVVAFLRFCNNTFARMEKQLALAATLLAAVFAARAETPLETAVLTAVREAHFERVVDFGAGNESFPVKAHLNLPAQTVAHTPNVNVAVIQL